MYSSSWYSTLHLSWTSLSRTSLYLELSPVPLGFDWYFLLFTTVYLELAYLESPLFVNYFSFPLVQKKTLYIWNKSQKSLVEIKKWFYKTLKHSYIEEVLAKIIISIFAWLSSFVLHLYLFKLRQIVTNLWFISFLSCFSSVWIWSQAKSSLFKIPIIFFEKFNLQ